MINPIPSSLQQADEAAVLELLQDAEVMRFLGPRRPLSTPEAQAWFESELQRPSRRVFRNDADGELIGFCGVKQLDGRLDFGYFLRRCFWGHGLARQMCQHTLGALASELDLARLHIFIASDNHASLKVAAALGWRRGQTWHDGHDAGWLFHLPEGQTSHCPVQSADA
ncbi:GNAT family N-acetyltransferase [Chitinilyticum piscinae]|uniref:GNAT family N-acetyltransferase n=1 Tax=Chitinilyticum piscinae TaxID=2866724 RepID=UPI0027E4CE5D|nr:GNAT family N-acetyltransferase [Chitinilyticum piscinae]